MKPQLAFIFGLLTCLSSLSIHAQLPFTQHPVPAGVPVNTSRMNDIVIDSQNNKWIPFGNFGLGVYDGTNWTMYNTANSGMPSDSVTSVDFDGSGNAWIGTNSGAVYKSGSTFNVYNISNSGLPSNIITTVFCETGTNWFGTYSGLVAFDGTNWNIYNIANSGIANDSITTIERDASGNLWVGTRNGLSKFANNVWTNYTTSNSILSRHIYDVEIDNAGRTWVTCGDSGPIQFILTTGVFIIENGSIQNFESAYLNNEVNVRYQNNLNLTKDTSGKIYFNCEFFGQRGIVQADAGDMEFFEYWGINTGVNASGSIFRIDNNNIMWTLPRYRFYFYSFDFSGYVQTFGGLNYRNHRYLDINDVVAGVNVAGDMHWDYINAEHEVPKGSGKNSVFSSAFWIGAMDEGGELHVAAQTYRQTGFDFWAGPIDGMNTPFDSSTCIQFDRIWKVDKWKVEEFKNQFLAGNVTNGSYTVPNEIASWPAKGNGNINTDMAPYIDTNNDGIYDVLSGDYPKINGDQMLYYIFNDSLGPHTNTAGNKMGVEVRVSAYAFQCQNSVDSNKVMNWTTLYNYQIINRSIHNYDSVYMGLWCDVDLGDPMDDNVGCDTTLSSGFVYNGDNDDDTNSGYGLNPPMQNIKILRGTLADPNDGADNDLDGLVDEPGERTTMNHFMYYTNANGTSTGNPNYGLDYYNYMKSVWPDGQHLTYGNDGTDPTAPLTNFSYSGVPYSGTGWTQLSTTVPDDRRMLLGSGPFSLDAGDTATLDFAYVFTWDSLSPNGLTTSIARNQADLQRVQQWFDTNSFPSCETYSVGISEELNPVETITAYPNPATTKLFLHSESGSLYGYSYEIYDLPGKTIRHGNIYSDNIDIENLAPQLYIMKVCSNNGCEYIRFVKN